MEDSGAKAVPFLLACLSVRSREVGVVHTGGEQVVDADWLELCVQRGQCCSQSVPHVIERFLPASMLANKDEEYPEHTNLKNYPQPPSEDSGL